MYTTIILITFRFRAWQHLADPGLLVYTVTLIERGVHQTGPHTCLYAVTTRDRTPGPRAPRHPHRIRPIHAWKQNQNNSDNDTNCVYTLIILKSSGVDTCTAVAPGPVPSGDICLGGSRYDVLAGYHGVYRAFGVSRCAEHVLGGGGGSLEVFRESRGVFGENYIKCVIKQVYIRSEVVDVNGNKPLVGNL